MSAHAANSNFKDWSLTDIKKTHGQKVLSVFHCGGGSTMGYKLAGYDVVGGVDIDPKMTSLYKVNHNPAYTFNRGVIEFNKSEAEQFRDKIYLLDGSPPCTPFSTAGVREEKWGVEKVFREGQASQVLDDLFFSFIETAKIINPKVVVAENVTGMLKGNARGYVKEIVKGFADIGYACRIFSLCASRFGVAQRRQRVFFVAMKDSNALANVKFEEHKQELNFCDIDDGDVQRKAMPPCDRDAAIWASMNGKQICNYFELKNKKSKLWNHVICYPNKPLPTIASHGKLIHHGCKGVLTDNELRKGQSFPMDYNFNGNEVQYVVGMSVPPLLTKAVADGIHEVTKHA